MEPKAKKGGSKWWRTLRNCLILLAVFSVGVSLGSGRIDFAADNPSNKQLPAELDYNEVQQVYESLKENYDGKLNKDQLEEGLKHGLATATKDPYTVYFTAKEAKEFETEINNHFSGIGAELGQDKDGNLEVIAPIDGFPAAKAGLRAKDIIATINGATTSGMSVDEAVSKIRGKAGTKVKLEVVRNKAEALTFDITRQEIKIPSVTTKTLDGNIGYIQIRNYANDTSKLTRQAAQQFKNSGVKGVILDLRNNGGGYLDGAIDVSSLWLPESKKILDTKQGTKVVDSQYSTGDVILNGVPTAVLINQGSASAAEITAGALADHKAAYLIGEKTYGKGVVQDLINFGDGSQLKVTTASWYRPNGQNINKKGITPHKTVKISDEQAEAAQDPQLEAAQAHLSR